MAWWNLLFGGAAQLVDAGKGVYTAIAGDEAAKDQQLSSEQMALINAYAAEFVARQQRSAFDSFADGLNRLIRPALAIGAQGAFVWAMVAPVSFAETMQVLAIVPEQLWWIWGGIFAFYFGGRIAENLPRKWKMEPRALEIAAQVTEARAARRATAAAAVAGSDERADIREGVREEAGEARAERADIREEQREEREDAAVYAGPIDNGSDTLRAMAATLWGEARGEPQEGKVAVAWVIRNRAANPGWWGKDVVGVCTAPWQFSCWFDKQKERVRYIDERNAQFVQCLAVARGVLDGSFPDPTGGADHYYAPAGMPGGREPQWAVGKTPTTRIGNHIFYRLGQVG